MLGADGLLQVDNIREQCCEVHKDGIVVLSQLIFLERYMPAYQAEWAAFVDALRG